MLEIPGVGKDLIVEVPKLVCFWSEDHDYSIRIFPISSQFAISCFYGWTNLPSRRISSWSFLSYHLKLYFLAMACFWVTIRDRAMLWTSSIVSIHRHSPSFLHRSVWVAMMTFALRVRLQFQLHRSFGKRSRLWPPSKWCRWPEDICMSSAHLPFFPSSCIFRAFRIDLLAASTCPLVCGCAIEANLSFILYFWQKSLKTWR